MNRAAHIIMTIGTVICLSSQVKASEGPAVKALSGPEIGGYLYTEFLASGTDFKERSFDLHYLALDVYGQMHEKIFYYAEFELEHGGTGGSNTFVEQAYIDFRLHRLYSIKVGAFLTPFNRFDDFHDPLANRLITRPDVARHIGVSAWKDVGVQVHGFAPLNQTLSIGYDVYVINGLGGTVPGNLRKGRQYRDNNTAMSIGGRLEAVILDRIALGGSIYSGKWDDADSLALNMVGGHAKTTLGALELFGEFAAFSQEQQGGPNIEGLGYFAQVGYSVTPKWHPSIRIGALDRWKKQDSMSLALTYYPVPVVAIKSEYVLRGGDSSDDEFWLQTAVRW